VSLRTASPARISASRCYAELEAAFVAASEERGLASYDRDTVRPLLKMPRTQWPRCCGRGCEPCAATLKAVAAGVQERLEGAG
jgi:hypothetical protein